MKKWLPLLVLAVFVASAAACSLSPSIFSISPSTQTQPAPTVSTVPQGSSQAISANLTTDAILAALYERVNPGVVSIVVTTADSAGSGSGFVYDKTVIFSRIITWLKALSRWKSIFLMGIRSTAM